MTLLQLRELRDLLDLIPMPPKYLASREATAGEIANGIHILDTAIREASRHHGHRPAAPHAIDPAIWHAPDARLQVMRENIEQEQRATRDFTPIRKNSDPRLWRENNTENEGWDVT